jgi:hypothetical protein
MGALEIVAPRARARRVITSGLGHGVASGRESVLQGLPRRKEAKLGS